MILTLIVFSLIGFSEKSCMILKGTGLPIKAKKEYIL
jgi:hypothetical protein